MEEKVIKSATELASERLQGQLSSLVKPENVSGETVVHVARKGMELMKNVRDVSGAEKAQIVQDITKKLVLETEWGKSEAVKVEFFMDEILPGAMQDLYELKKSAFKEIKETGCFGLC